MGGGVACLCGIRRHGGHVGTARMRGAPTETPVTDRRRAYRFSTSDRRWPWRRRADDNHNEARGVPERLISQRYNRNREKGIDSDGGGEFTSFTLRLHLSFLLVCFVSGFAYLNLRSVVRCAPPSSAMRCQLSAVVFAA